MGVKLLHSSQKIYFHKISLPLAFGPFLFSRMIRINIFIENPPKVSWDFLINLIPESFLKSKKCLEDKGVDLQANLEVQA